MSMDVVPVPFNRRMFESLSNGRDKIVMGDGQGYAPVFTEALLQSTQTIIADMIDHAYNTEVICDLYLLSVKTLCCIM